MSDDTLPPHQPNTPRTWITRAWNWCRTHPEYSIPAATFIVGLLIGKWAS